MLAILVDMINRNDRIINFTEKPQIDREFEFCNLYDEYKITDHVKYVDYDTENEIKFETYDGYSWKLIIIQ